VVNAETLRPTASREAFYEDDDLEATREALGGVLRDYLVGLSARDPVKLQRLIALHDLSLKGLALHDDEFYRLFIDWFRFETSMGTMTLGEYRRDHEVVRFVPDLDRFRQIARVASAQGLCVINAGYTHDAELLARMPFVVPEAEVEAVDPASLAQTLEDLTVEERDDIHALISLADRELQPFKCAAEAKKFLPEELPTLYSTARDAEFHRSRERSMEVADPLWGAVLGSLAGEGSVGPYAQLTFNYRNPLVRRIAKIADRTVQKRSVEMLYIQALLLGHHPLSAREMSLLNEGLIGLIEWSVSR
jgi:molecular chaperone HtpG